MILFGYPSDERSVEVIVFCLPGKTGDDHVIGESKEVREKKLSALRVHILIIASGNAWHEGEEWLWLKLMGGMGYSKILSNFIIKK